MAALSPVSLHRVAFSIIEGSMHPSSLCYKLGTLVSAPRPGLLLWIGSQTDSGHTIIQILCELATLLEFLTWSAGASCLQMAGSEPVGDCMNGECYA